MSISWWNHYPLKYPSLLSLKPWESASVLAHLIGYYTSKFFLLNLFRNSPLLPTLAAIALVEAFFSLWQYTPDCNI